LRTDGAKQRRGVEKEQKSMDIWERAQPRSHFVKEQLIFAEPDGVGLW
jgi:hypothetical protein